jgi:hypothetical protein
VDFLANIAKEITSWGRLARPRPPLRFLVDDKRLDVVMKYGYYQNPCSARVGRGRHQSFEVDLPRLPALQTTGGPLWTTMTCQNLVAEPSHGFLQAFVDRDFRLPAQLLTRQPNIGATALRIILCCRHVLDQ